MERLCFYKTVIFLENNLIAMVDNSTSYFLKNPKVLFLIDSIGAMFTAFFLYGILRNFNEYVGIDKTTLTYLAAIGLCFCFYSAICFLFLKEKWKPFLLIISAANALYCLLTLSMLFINYSQLTTIGLVYFLIEITIICGLVFVEVNVAFNIKS